MPTPFLRAVVLGFVLAAGASTLADTIVQEGGLSGEAGPPTEHLIVLDQFDSMDGTRILNAVTLEFQTILFAEAVTNGEGGFIHLYASLSADYSYLNGPLIAETEAMIEDVVDNGDLPFSILYLDEDLVTVELVQPRDLAPWRGDGAVELMAMAQMTLVDDPPDVIDFFGSGMVTYVVTYDYDVQPACPADLDGDGTVDGADLGILLSCWGGSGAECDLDGDGSVDGADLGLMLTAWGPCD